MQFNKLQQATLLRRYKRFLADVELPNGDVMTVHCPNTGAMTGCAEPGSPVWLSHSAAKTRKYPHTWELVETAAGLACIHSARANKVVREGFEQGLVSGFDLYPNLRSEVKYGDGHRIDLLLEGEPGQVYVEVKCVTLCREDGWGLFPDAVSERGRRHLLALREVARGNGVRAVLFFCVFHNAVQAVSAAGEIDPRYRAVLEEVMADGVEVLAWRADVSVQGLQLAQPLPFTLDPEG